MWPPSGYEEIEFAAEVANWIYSQLQCVLPQNIIGDLHKFAVAGHSRGGYAAFALALGHAKTPLKVKISALAGVDPVAGTSIKDQLEPKILDYVASSMNLTIPVTVIGSGLGDQSVFPMSPACAPDGVNHKEFFYECKPPCSHFVATDYGHMDFLNDQLNLIGDLARAGCKGCWPWVSRNPLRSSAGGILVAFLETYFKGESHDYLAILHKPSLAPAKLDPVQFKDSSNIAQV
ncbi:hypothetical protein Tsubulata_044188 [Turnera subulata]|uniref:Chlorophyllase n=1 Tax=Turnera subulata TaxID=218843 RepID=A0A9Q0J272_9ROSI|nr:hypothetical protein Tsubulata_044188 [Turnera subulata]